MCLRRAPEKYIAGAKASAGASLDRAVLNNRNTDSGEVSLTRRPHFSSTQDSFFFFSQIYNLLYNRAISKYVVRKHLCGAIIQ
jgi:hypothetical protein